MIRTWTAALLALSEVALVATVTSSGVTFHKDVLPILQKNCQNCHRPGQIGPMSLLAYDEVRPWAKSIKQAVLTKKMPPWFADPQYGHFSNDRTLKPAEIATLVKWVDGGAAAGDPKMLRRLSHGRKKAGASSRITSSRASRITCRRAASCRGCTSPCRWASKKTPG